MGGGGGGGLIRSLERMEDRVRGVITESRSRVTQLLHELRLEACTPRLICGTFVSCWCAQDECAQRPAACKGALMHAVLRVLGMGLIQ